MWQALAVILPSAVTVGALVYLRAYITEKAKVIAGEAASRALEDYRLEHQKLLAALQTEHQRQLHEFSLYTRRRHLVYARLYKLARIASDAYVSLHNWIQEVPDYKRWSIHQVKRYFETVDVHESDASAVAIIDAYQRQEPKRGAQLLEVLDRKVRRHRARQSLQHMTNYEAINELYLSEEVNNAIEAVRIAIVEVSVRSDEEEDGDITRGERKELAERVTRMRARVQHLRQVIQRELRRGEPEATATNQAVRETY